MSKVYSYLRFSNVKQAEGTSIDRQLTYATKWAAEHGLTLDTSLTLRDEGLSAYHEAHVKRGALGVFLELVERGKVPKGSILIVESLDRLSRAEPIQAQAQLAQIINGGVTVVTASDDKQYSRASLRQNPMDLIYSLLIMIRAHEESSRKADLVTKAIVRRCVGWQQGTYRGLIRQGRAPAWLELVEGEWRFIPERVKAIRKALELFRAGYGPERIQQELKAKGLTLTNEGGVHATQQIYRLATNRALYGVNELTVGGEVYLLDGYYPALMTRAEFDDLGTLRDTRRAAKTRDRSALPCILVGNDVGKCGYCGQCMVSQVQLGRARTPEGFVSDGYRRLRCKGNNAFGAHRKCSSQGGSASAAPFERALMAYCSDMLNLRGLYEGDRTIGPKQRLDDARATVQSIDAKLAKLMAVIEESDKPSRTMAARVRTLEDERVQAQAAIEAAERELSAVARINLKGADAKWRELAAAVEAQDYEARLKARKLVADTFERIALYWKPDAQGRYAMVLRARGGITRTLLIDKQGKWQHAEEMGALPELMAA